jgi:phage-related protein
MPTWAVSYYQTRTGVIPIRVFVETLSGPALIEAAALLKLLPLGTALKEPRSKALGDGLIELRGRAAGVRIFYTFRPGRRVVALDGYLKKRQDIPSAVLARMRALKRDLEEREQQ